MDVNAVVIQKFCRAHLAKNEVIAQRADRLSPTLVRQAITLIVSPRLRMTPVAHSGHTTVHLPDQPKVRHKSLWSYCATPCK